MVKEITHCIAQQREYNATVPQQAMHLYFTRVKLKVGDIGFMFMILKKMEDFSHLQ